MQIKDVVRFLEQWAPPAYAENYDNVGLLTGNVHSDVKGIVVSLDCTEAVVDEAIARGCNMVVSHHPIIFRGLKKLTGSNYVERAVIKAIKNDVALYAIHTNLDSVPTGVNERFGESLGLANLRILRPKPEALRMLMVFVPHDSAEAVRNALYRAGAGNIGNYKDCSFNISGKGTFTPVEGANPATGAVGQPETVDETLVQVIFPLHLEGQVVASMRSAHPYEEVAHYVVPLANDNPYAGAGMIGEVPVEMSETDFLEHVKSCMKAGVVRHTALRNRPVKRVAICGGSGSFLLSDAIRAGADIFVTGDFKYHEFFDAEDRIVIADIGHYESEQFTINLLAEKLKGKFTTFATHLTEVNTNPIHYL